jgi:hypothetical protein
MKKTTDFYVAEQDPCETCKHWAKTDKEAPCDSCVVSKWEAEE